ncbi:type 1 glutamine amidotransferase domain-containing protein [Terriglobus albidus]|uniref:type 1 glutamine amidotransferase domain-containing protein n=1 Tax=Terriglobus albidus TaxID=1592106 RepID=UPI0021E07ED0|nr:type 1 glutamine amidotransferase domain-containing protein [Terriglobus albidus]
MANELNGRRVAILATDGFEQVELTGPQKALKAAGATVEVVSPKPGEVKGWDMTDWGETVKVDVELKSAKASDYDALILPGGVMNPDRLRMDAGAVSFVKEFFTAGKPVSAICHGPWTLIEAGVVKGRTMTSWPSLKTDLMNAGAIWVDREVVEDNGLVTSRKPDDLKAFNATTINRIADAGRRRSAA